MSLDFNNLIEKNKSSTSTINLSVFTCTNRNMIKLLVYSGKVLLMTALLDCRLYTRVKLIFLLK